MATRDPGLLCRKDLPRHESPIALLGHKQQVPGLLCGLCDLRGERLPLSIDVTPFLCHNPANVLLLTELISVGLNERSIMGEKAKRFT